MIALGARSESPPRHQEPSTMDVVLLSRLQFAFTIMFHYLFPPLTIGMGVVLVFLDGRWVWTRDPVYERAARFWTGIFALNFAVGVATGIVMEFEFGANWATYSRFVGDIFGSALASEGIFAFFLESGFLALLVFGWDYIEPRLHFFATCMVALGSIFSSIWIVVANSWQQTPAGHRIVPMLHHGAPWVVGGVPVTRAEIVDFWAMIFNPSSVERLVHVWLGCLIMGGFFVMSISAWYVLRERHRAFAERSFKAALVMATAASLLVFVSGDRQAKGVYRNQPAKLAAFEAQFATGPGDMSLIGIPDPATETMRFNLAIPGLVSYLLFHDSDATMTGLDRFRPEDRPPVAIPYFAYHLMLGLGSFFAVLTLTGCFFWWRGTLFQQRWLLWVFVFAVVGAVAANEAGWVAAEVGRQPWVVQPPVPYDADGQLVLDAEGHVAYDDAQGLRTADAASPAIDPRQVQQSLGMFGLIYSLLLGAWIYLLNERIRQGPEPPGVRPAAAGEGVMDTAAGRPGRKGGLARPADQREG
jgi:cytochrome d ubiquinol oxidase subunit I